MKFSLHLLYKCEQRKNCFNIKRKKFDKVSQPTILDECQTCRTFILSPFPFREKHPSSGSQTSNDRMADATSLNVVKFATPRVPIASLSSPWPPWSQYSKYSPTFSLSPSFSLLFRVVTGERQHHCELCIPHARFARLSLAQLSLINLFERAIVRSIAAHPIGGSNADPWMGSRGCY